MVGGLGAWSCQKENLKLASFLCLEWEIGNQIDAVDKKHGKIKKMPKIDTLDALDDEMTSIFNTL